MYLSRKILHFQYWNGWFLKKCHCEALWWHETYVGLFLLTHKCKLHELFAPWMLLEIAIFRAIIWLLWPTPFLANISILHTVPSGHQMNFKPSDIFGNYYHCSAKVMRLLVHLPWMHVGFSSECPFCICYQLPSLVCQSKRLTLLIGSRREKIIEIKNCWQPKKFRCPKWAVQDDSIDTP